VTKKIDALNNNTTDVPHLNMLQSTTKPTRLKGGNVAHQLNNNITMCTQSHACPPPRSKGENVAHQLNNNITMCTQSHACPPPRSKGEIVAHQLNNNITMRTQSHACPPPRSILGRTLTHYVDFNSIAQGHHFT
jgi:hypothetical protein